MRWTALVAAALATACASSSAEPEAPSAQVGARVAASSQDPARAAPRLVVVIVVDQLRGDYLDRFAPWFGDSGFARFTAAGARMTQGAYEHGVTVTCAGHAVVLTGAHATTTGIVANDWYDREDAREEYCSLDESSPLVGHDGEGRSPRNLLVSTVGDELQLSNGGRSRVVTVAGKDRSAIMLGGHLADGAYWLEDTLFVTSTYYRAELPDWARRFNASGAVTGWFHRSWERLLPASAYAVQGPDDEPFEADEGNAGRTFPHPIGAGEDRPGEGFVESFENTPYHNDVVVAFAMEAVRNEQLGRDETPDLLGLGLSANDRVGHAYGPDSHEVMDITIRTDRLLADFFAFLDREVGADRWTAVLTADHGVSPIPEVAARLHEGWNARRIDPAVIDRAVEQALAGRFGDAPADAPWVAFNDGHYIHIDHRLLARRSGSIEEAERIAAAAIEAVDGVHQALTRTELIRARAAGQRTPLLLSFHPDRSGHVMYTFDPYILEDDEPTGTGHGSPWMYDRLVPIAFYGPGIRAGTHHAPASVADIAPTLAVLLGIGPPSASEGRVLEEVLD